MTTVPHVAHAMQKVLTTVADQAARDTHFVQRESTLTGAKLTQTLVFGWLSNPEATLEDLAQTAATVGVSITPQGLDERLSQTAAECLKQVLDAAIEEVITAQPVAIPLLQRFTGVSIQESTSIARPDALAEVWHGCGSRTGQGQAARTVQGRLNLSHGALNGPVLQDGRTSDRRSPHQTAPLPAGALRLADLGFFSLSVLAELTAQGVYWLTRPQAGTAVFDATGQRHEWGDLLQTQGRIEGALPIHLGAEARLPCRLLAVRVRAEVANRRRQRLHADAQRRGRAASPERMALADWTLLLTNAPAELLAVREALVIARARWQIELLFKLWKTHGRIDESRSQKPWRMLCEVYAKLLAMLVQHWLVLVSCWIYPDRSVRKAAHTVQHHALHLASVLPSCRRLSEALAVIQRCLAVGCRINKRKTAPHTYQLLLDLAQEGALA